MQTNHKVSTYVESCYKASTPYTKRIFNFHVLIFDMTALGDWISLSSYSDI